jgi:hypothetical protein
LGDWQASGLSQAAFCRRRGIPIWKFAWWKRRLGTEGIAPVSPFVPVGVVMSAPAGDLELTLRGGRMLRFSSGVDVAKLAGIVATLEALPC